MNYGILKLINVNIIGAALGFFSLIVIYKNKMDNNEFERRI